MPLKRLALPLVVAVFGAVVLANAWVGEDAYISFRTVDNFVRGYGLRWNIDERVQVYTHPLWVFLNTPLYALTRDVATTVTILGMACSLGAFFLVARRHRESPGLLAGAVLLPLVLSHSFVLYSTSGFENPLGHLLYAWFAVVYLRLLAGGPVPWGTLVAVASLSATNRLDSVLLFLPPMGLLVLTRWRDIRFGRILLGSLPLVVWLAFATLYYGFPFPNTGPAKLQHEIPALEYMAFGWNYVMDLLTHDGIAFGVMVVALGATAVHGAAAMKSRLRDERATLLAGFGLGVFLYELYVLRIGGDFLSGRFWTLPLFGSVILVAESLVPVADALRTAGRGRRVGFAAAVVAAGLLLTFVPPRLDLTSREDRIQERSHSHLRMTRSFRWEPSNYAVRYEERGRKARRAAARSDGPVVRVVPQIGLTGFGAGPHPILIDSHGLGDALIARLPPKQLFIRRIGHFKRAVPEGYVHARETGSTEQMHPALAEYYEALRKLTSAPVFDSDRLSTLVAFHLGRFDGALAEYVAQMPVAGPGDDEGDDEDEDDEPLESD